MGVVPATNCVHDDPPPCGFRQDNGILHVVLIIHVRWRITHQKHYLVAVGVLTPGDLVNGIGQRLINALRIITSAVSLEVHKRGVYRI